MWYDMYQNAKKVAQILHPVEVYRMQRLEEMQGKRNLHAAGRTEPGQGGLSGFR